MMLGPSGSQPVLPTHDHETGQILMDTLEPVYQYHSTNYIWFQDPYQYLWASVISFVNQYTSSRISMD